MRREPHVRFCERAAVKLHRATHLTILDALGGEFQQGAVRADGNDEASESAANGSSEALKGIGDEPSKEPPWDPDKTPLQVRLVDLLETLQAPPFGRKPFRVAVIVSAWDLTDETSADKWLSKRYPLLDQFLRNGHGASDVRVYGVSAQGGQLSKKGQAPGPDREMLLALHCASERINIVGTEVTEHDLTCPLLWLSGLDQSLSTQDLEQVDQALFGYSDGHRQIAASIRLPSKDLYNLAAASDLASGAKLGPEDSYLTGLPLAVSRRFALIRTWPAPEMPRPGCVWSHVLLIDFQLLSSHGDLSDFPGLLKTPSEVGPGFYSKPTSFRSSHPLRSTPDSESVVELIQTYYSGEPVLLDYRVDQGALEGAIMAVWSQQWPRLRASLWRYGRDLSAPRKQYRTLVELFLKTKNRSEVSGEEATRIFDAIPEGDGEILKRDLLGMGSASPALCSPIDLIGLLQLLARDDKLAFAIIRRDFGSSNDQLFRSMPAIILDACIEAALRLELNSAWVQVIAENSNAILATDYFGAPPSW